MSSIREKLASKTTKLTQHKGKVIDHPASLANYQNGEFYRIPLNAISPDPSQPRQHFDQTALTELAESIKQKGVLQPVIVRQDHDRNQQFLLIAGERRFRAAKMVGLDEIPAIISTGNPAEISLIENIQRENLKPLEEAEAYQRMIDEYDYTQEKLAHVIGRARSSITEAISLNKLPAEIKDECRHVDISMRTLVELAKQKDKKLMLGLFQKIKAGDLKSVKVREIRQHPRKIKPAIVVILTRLESLLKALAKIDSTDLKYAEREKLAAKLKELAEHARKFS